MGGGGTAPRIFSFCIRWESVISLTPLGSIPSSHPGTEPVREIRNVGSSPNLDAANRPRGYDAARRDLAQ
jgi:hypothetical protein